LNSPDVLGLVLSEGMRHLDEYGIVYEVKDLTASGMETKGIARVIRQRCVNNGTKTELLIAYF
jgi:hypothetical protein